MGIALIDRHRPQAAALPGSATSERWRQEAVRPGEGRRLRRRRGSTGRPCRKRTGGRRNHQTPADWQKRQDPADGRGRRLCPARRRNSRLLRSGRTTPPSGHSLEEAYASRPDQLAMAQHETVHLAAAALRAGIRGRLRRWCRKPHGTRPAGSSPGRGARPCLHNFERLLPDAASGRTRTYFRRLRRRTQPFCRTIGRHSGFGSRHTSRPHRDRTRKWPCCPSAPKAVLPIQTWTRSRTQ
jgi:hypothetical protein